MACERTMFGRSERAVASLEQDLALINPGLAVALNIARRLGGGLKLSAPPLSFTPRPFCLCEPVSLTGKL